MTSKIVVNNIEADAGVSTVTFNSNVQRGSSNLHSTGLNVNDTFVHSTGIASVSYTHLTLPTNDQV